MVESISLTGLSKFRLCVGTLFCLVDGFVFSLGLSNVLAITKGVVIAAVVSFGVAFAVNRKNWNGMSRWLVWIPLVVGAIFAYLRSDI
jgi:hypothetical protein